MDDEQIKTSMVYEMCCKDKFIPLFVDLIILEVVSLSSPSRFQILHESLFPFSRAVKKSSYISSLRLYV